MSNTIYVHRVHEHQGYKAWQCTGCGQAAPMGLGSWVTYENKTTGPWAWFCGPCLWFMCNVAGTVLPTSMCVAMPSGHPENINGM